jgi:hypothetical protein
MKREIKFRAWNPDTKEIYEWNSIKQYPAGQLFNVLNEKFIIMEFTNLKDKNGKEIYEGDIIKSGKDALGVVKWRHFGFEQDMINTLGWWVIQEDGEVIGNIYENPELLQ